jgi:hypothetical protein
MIKVIDSDKEPYIKLDNYPKRTNLKEVIINGLTLPGCKITLDSKGINVEKDGSFILKLALKEGINKFEVRSINPKGIYALETIEIELVLKGPKLIIKEFPDDLHDITEFLVEGEVEPADSEVFVNDTKATVIFGKFTAKIEVRSGTNKILFRATDEFKNETILEKELFIYRKVIIVLKIGSKVMMKNGQSYELDSEPFILNSRTMVPIRAIAEAFGAEVKWFNKTQTVEIALDGIFISMQIGNRIAMVGNKVYMLDAPPVIRDNRTFVPVRFIAEGLNSKVEWDSANSTVLIERLSK